MPRLYPDLAANGARFGTKRSTGRQPQPRLWLEALVAFFDAPFDHEQLDATLNRQRNRRAGRPPLEANVFVAVLEQRHDFDAHSIPVWKERHLACVDAHV